MTKRQLSYTGTIVWVQTCSSYYTKQAQFKLLRNRSQSLDKQVLCSAPKCSYKIK